MSRITVIAFLLSVSSVAPIPLMAQQAVEQDIVWPQPPEAPRVRYVGFLYSERDLGKKRSFLSKLGGALIGSEEQNVSVNRPHDLFVDAEGRIFLTNGIQPGFWVFDADEKKAKLIVPSGASSLGKPMGITGNSDGRLYIADARSRRVVAMTVDGTFLAAFGGYDVLLNPVDVAVSPDGRLVYVADSYLHQVLIFNVHDGALLTRIGRHEGDLQAKVERRRGQLSSSHGVPTSSPSDSMTTPGHPAWDDEPSDLVENRGAGPGEFRYPAFLAVAPSGTLYVSDGLNFRVQVFSPEGEFLRQFGRLGDGPGTFARPKGITVDSQEHVYVVDAAFNNVQMFDGDGRHLMAFAEFGNGAGQLWLPTGLAADGRDRIFVADRVNNRIQVFEYLPPTPEVPAGVKSPS